ncbi:MAG: peptidylprolyl isomerase [Deltaproteobacteria bacterium]|nr:peptidylprolyl isomerase [Deltaproteobacteria bacterium]
MTSTAATIVANKVATIHYILSDDTGATIDSSRNSDPMPYLHGGGNIVPGLERKLEGASVGDRVKAVVTPADGYGEKSDVPPQPVPLSAFGGAPPEPGMPVTAQDEEGNHAQFWIVEVTDEAVMITADHPLAGVTLHFDVEVMSIRDATDAELEHGHAHPGDGHHHPE